MIISNKNSFSNILILYVKWYQEIEKTAEEEGLTRELFQEDKSSVHSSGIIDNYQKLLNFWRNRSVIKGRFLS